MTRSIVLVLLGLAASGCRNVAMVEILHAVVPDATCNVAASNNISSSGIYDPTLNDTGYDLALILRNNLQQRSDDTVAYGTANWRNRLNDVLSVGFEGCWFQDTGKITSFGAFDNGQIVDCKTLPNQSGSMPANGEIDEGGLTTAVMQTTVLNLGQLQQLFGSKYRPQAIHRGVLYKTIGVNGQDANALYFGTTDPSNTASRDANWGNYPTTRNAPVIVQLRGILTLQSGDPIYTNWFAFPIDVCTGCLWSDCGDLVEQDCTAALATACTTPPCNKFIGNVPDFSGGSGTTVCLPAQNQPAPSCTPITCTSTP